MYVFDETNATTQRGFILFGYFDLAFHEPAFSDMFQWLFPKSWLSKP